MHVESWTHREKILPKTLIALRHELPRAGTPQLEQSGAKSARALMGMVMHAISATLGRTVKGHSGALALALRIKSWPLAKSQVSSWLTKVHRITTNVSVVACAAISSLMPMREKKLRAHSTGEKGRHHFDM